MREKKQASETMLQNLYKHCMEAKVVDGGGGREQEMTILKLRII